MREDIENIISEELDKVQVPIEDLYGSVESEIKDKVDSQNQKLENDINHVMQSVDDNDRDADNH